MFRALLVLLHRWVGLTLATFLLVVGLSGSLLAFLPELDRGLTPRLFPPSRGGVELGLAELARRAEYLVPQGQVDEIDLRDAGVAAISIEARDAAAPIDFDTLYLDAGTGGELGRVRAGAFPRAVEEITPFLYNLHTQLASGDTGGWILGIVALAWTPDCFAALVLTLPRRGARARGSFLARWRTAWLIRAGASTFRLNFDLHRAGGLWLWFALLIFAWSGVYMNLNDVYAGATRLALDYVQPVWARPAPLRPPDPRKPLDWDAAEAAARGLMDGEARKFGFRVGRATTFYFMRDRGLYEYSVRSSRDIGERGGRTTIDFDAYTGALSAEEIPTGSRSGVTLTTWLVELHMANLFGLPYRIFVSALGLGVATLSITGVYVWWKKRRGARSRPRRAAPGAETGLAR